MVKAQTVKGMGARFCSRANDSSKVSESLPPETPTATRSPARIMRNLPIASPTLRRTIFSTSTFLTIHDGVPFCEKAASGGALDCNLPGSPRVYLSLHDSTIAASRLRRWQALGISRWRAFCHWWLSTWRAIKPGPEARRGAKWAAWATIVWTVFVGAASIKLGYGYWANFGFALLAAAV